MDYEEILRGFRARQARYMRDQEEVWKTYGTTQNWKEPTPREATILGLVYGDTYNAYADWDIQDRGKRLKFNKVQSDMVVGYMKSRYQYWNERIP